MAKGVSVKLKTYQDTIPKLLKLIKLDEEIKKHNKIILKPVLRKEHSTKPEFVEPILRFCLQHKNPEAEIFIAEGADGFDTLDIFDQLGYKKLSEAYSIGLIDLNEAETEEIVDTGFLRTEKVKYPKVLLDSFIISMPYLIGDEETEINGSLSGMLGAYPASEYKGLFSSKKSKIRKYPLKFAIHDILKCKMPDLAVVDGSFKGVLLAGMPLEIDKQGAKLLGVDWKLTYIKLVDESFNPQPVKSGKIIQLIR